jgi:DNA-directed RNA polymerase specialized sigma24 family protein
VAVSNELSVTCWLDGLKAGNHQDIERLWTRYFQRLVRLAGARLPAHSRRVFDEEDVALSAFHSFCERAGRGQFPQLRDREDLWRLLATITVRKALDRMRHQTRQKRGGGLVLGESALLGGEHTEAGGVWEILSKEPAPEDVAGFAEDYERLLARLVDPALKTIALLKMEGQTAQEIAVAYRVSTKTIERKLRLIRTIWSQETPE